MTQFFVPPKNVRAPELLVGRKPTTGPVEIDWGNSLSKDLYMYVLHRGDTNDVRDMLDKVPPNGSGSLAHKFDSRGSYWTSTAGNAYEDLRATKAHIWPVTMIMRVRCNTAVSTGTFNLVRFVALSGGHNLGFQATQFQWQFTYKQSFTGPTITVTPADTDPVAGGEYLCIFRSDNASSHRLKIIRLDTGASNETTDTSSKILNPA